MVEVPMGWGPLFVHCRGGCLGEGIWGAWKERLCFSFTSRSHLTWRLSSPTAPVMNCQEAQNFTSLGFPSLLVSPSHLVTYLLHPHSSLLLILCLMMVILSWYNSLWFPKHLLRAKQGLDVFTCVIALIFLMVLLGRWWYFQLIYQKVEAIFPKPHN